ncbi:hypothetical protein M433DRAFT_75325 [Acidomyces richmondensis BFW]|nr:MAG: hypothetical protein FE78DRAFT_267569 [Acidomyces sp. 'richmondensis']KYG41702.1 hypothetical protein M433DRAFT_75325 [Acidomyces richmondensis BFW]
MEAFSAVVEPRPAQRTRPSATVIQGRQRTESGTPGSPRTPLLGRSISSQFGSPGSFRGEQDDQVIYELGARHLSAGFAGESRPRCIIRFGPEQGRRVGDDMQWDSDVYLQKQRRKRSGWGEDHQLYCNDVRGLDLGLVEDKLERIVRQIHSEFLQLDPKPRKAVLAIQSLLPNPLVDIALKVLFNHSSQPSNIMILTNPVLTAVSAGLRCALVVDIGWEETIVTAVGEYKEVHQRRSIRAGKMLTYEMADVVRAQLKLSGREEAEPDFKSVESVVERMGWCRPRSVAKTKEGKKVIPISFGGDVESINIAFEDLSIPAERTLFASNVDSSVTDDHELALPKLAYNVLLALPTDLRALCVSRIVITGGASNLPGVKHRLLRELQTIIEARGWDPVENYGSTSTRHQRILRKRNERISAMRQTQESFDASSANIQLSLTKRPIQESVPHHQRLHDDIKDPITLKAERRTSGKQMTTVKAIVRGVESLGAWQGASLVASLRVKGLHEIEREDFLKHGIRDASGVIF